MNAPGGIKEADGVFAGGGVKGIAFAGAIKAAEEFEYAKWRKLAGTSAGAITAMLLAVGYDAEKLHEILKTMDLKKIADFGPLGKIEAIENLIVHDGLTRGVYLHKWLGELVEKAPAGVKTFGELEAKFGPEKLQVVGTDIAHTRMVVFPRDVALYVGEDGKPFDPKDFPIADAVRVSAGFPYFFPPIKMRDAQTGKDGVLVDGGVVSAYPIFLFDKPDPKFPTWGFRLYSGNPPEAPPFTKIGGVDWPIDMLEAILDTSMNALDQFESKQFGNRTISIPTGDIETLDFELSEAQKTELFDFGHQAAKEFFGQDPPPTGENTFGEVPAQSR